MTKQELLQENDQLLEVLREFREKLSDVLDEEEGDGEDE